MAPKTKKPKREYGDMAKDLAAKVKAVEPKAEEKVEPKAVEMIDLTRYNLTTKWSWMEFVRRAQTEDEMGYKNSYRGESWWYMQKVVFATF